MRLCNNICHAAFCAATISSFMLLVCQAGCSESRTSAAPRSPVVGDMHDTSYYGHRGQKFRPNAEGQLVCVDQFEGRFLWADYAAPWCAPCKQQSQDIRNLEGNCGDDVVFLTVMTSDMGGYGDPATRRTAEKWSKSFGLDPSRVLAADLTSTTIPKHILFSPDGQVLFEQTGQMGAAEIRATLARCKQVWQAWKSSQSSQ